MYWSFVRRVKRQSSRVLMSMSGVWGLTLCRWASSSRRFEGSYFLYLRGQAVQEELFHTSGSTRPVTHGHLPEDLNLQQHRWENFKSLTSTSLFG